MTSTTAYNLHTAAVLIADHAAFTDTDALTRVATSLKDLATIATADGDSVARQYRFALANVETVNPADGSGHRLIGAAADMLETYRDHTDNTLDGSLQMIRRIIAADFDTWTGVQPDAHLEAAFEHMVSGA